MIDKHEYIAYCGLDCEACKARLATINNDKKVGTIIGNNPDALICSVATFAAVQKGHFIRIGKGIKT